MTQEQPPTALRHALGVLALATLVVGSGCPAGAERAAADVLVNAGLPDAAAVDSVIADVITADAVIQDSIRDITAPPDEGATRDRSVDANPATSQLRVATFNCWCLTNSPTLRAKGIALEVQRLRPDVVGLQEVCQSQGGSGLNNFAGAVAAEIKALTGADWEHRIAKTHVAWSQWDEGVGLLAPKGRIKAHGEQTLPKGSGVFARKVIWGRIGTDRGDLLIYSTHLSFSASPMDRAAQVKSILTLVAVQTSSLPQIVVGDLNDWYASPAASAMKQGPPVFTEAWGAKHPGSGAPGLTCCHPSYGSRIDYIFIKTASIKSLDTVSLAFDKAYGGQVLSDHRGLFAAFTPL